MSYSLFSYGSLMLSAAANTSVSGAPVPFWSVGTEIDIAPITGLNDGVLATYVAAEEATASPALDLRLPQRADAVMAGNHNITAGTVRVQSSNAADFGVLITDVPAPYRQPNFWYDLRFLSVLNRTARYWRLHVTGNAAPLRIGELVVAQVEAVPHFQWGFSENRTYPERDQGTTPMGSFTRRKLGFGIRDMTATRFAGPDATVDAVLRRVAYSAGTTVIPTLFIPESDGTDAWLVDWEDTYVARRIIENRREATLVIPEQSPGLLTALLGTRAAAAGSVSMHFVEAYLTANVSIPNNTATPLAFNAEQSDTSGMHDTVSNPSRFTVPVGAGGIWVFCPQVSWAPSSGAWAATILAVNGSKVKAAEGMLHASLGLTIAGAFSVLLNAGDYFEVHAHQNSGGAVLALGGSRDLSSLSAFGPVA